MMKLARRFLRDERGLELSEYAVMAALIIVAILTAIFGLRGAIETRFNQLRDAIGTDQ
jgi:Flp pilus assembly pilin Flp